MVEVEYAELKNILASQVLTKIATADIPITQETDETEADYLGRFADIIIKNHFFYFVQDCYIRLHC